MPAVISNLQVTVKGQVGGTITALSVTSPEGVVTNLTLGSDGTWSHTVSVGGSAELYLFTTTDTQGRHATRTVTIEPLGSAPVAIG